MSFSKNSKIYIAGHNGMVGSAICRKLNSLGYYNLILKSSKDLDLRNQKQTQDFFKGATRICFFSCCQSRWNFS